jgi:hypothetical protein
VARGPRRVCFWRHWLAGALLLFMARGPASASGAAPVDATIYASVIQKILEYPPDYRAQLLAARWKRGLLCQKFKAAVRVVMRSGEVAEAARFLGKEGWWGREGRSKTL